MDNTLGLDVHGTVAIGADGWPIVESTASPRVQRDEDVEDGQETWWPEPSASPNQNDKSKDEEDGEETWWPEGPASPKRDDKSKDVNEDGQETWWSEGPASPKQDDKSKKDKAKPYVPATPVARAKMSPEELAERMEKIRLQNEKIKERREHVKADEEAFNTSVAADRAKQAANRKVQAQINQNREQNAKRKLEKMGVREWDSGKQGGEWKQGKRPTEDKGKGNFFSSATPSRDAGTLHTSATDAAVPKGSSPPSTGPTKRHLREGTPHTTKARTSTSQTDDVKIGEKKD